MAEFEAQVYRKDGSEVWTLESARAVHAGGTLLFYEGTVEDISTRKHAEEALRQAQKMEAVGRLAGGVAHDFNNLLTVINGFSEMVLGHLHDGDPLREPVQQIKRAGDRATVLTRQLLVLSRKQVLVPVVLDLNAVLADLTKILPQLIGQHVAARICGDPNLGRVKADAGQLEQVMLNLVVNARDAMPAGGELILETSNVVLDDAYAAGHAGVQPGDYVQLAVSDTGSGIDPSILERIFEPFFTTKGPEEGTGLGLAIVYGIVKQSGGHVEVFSEVGVGTTFKVYLPRVRDALPEAVAADSAPVGPVPKRCCW